MNRLPELRRSSPRAARARTLVSPAAMALAALTSIALASWPDGATMQEEAPPAASPFDAHRERLEGVWELQTPRAEARRIVDRSIERTVAAMNFFVRGVARGQLQDNTPINRRITLRFESGERVAVHFSSTNVRLVSRIGRTTRTEADGTEIRLTQRFRGEVLEQVFETDEGTRWNTYHRTGEDTLRLDAITQGMMMPEALRFSLNYRRARR